MSQTEPPRQETRKVRSRYDRIASVYDAMEKLVEPRYRDWRERAWSLVRGSKVLEVGVGTGKNMRYYPPEADVVAIDLSEGMLERARRRAQRLGIPVTLKQMDAQQLEFPDDTFDSAIDTFVYCSVPEPIRGMREMARVTKPGGPIVMVEHMRSPNPIVGAVMDAVDPLVSWLAGPHINRRTVENVRRAGLELDRVEDLGAGGIFKLIVAHKG
jgi:ubiquinone/menaquinone biosynthesis C-methylase UbiE